MTDKQKMFADEYLANGFQAGKAYLAVYRNTKSESAAYANSCRMLNYPEVKEYIQQRMKEIQTEKTADAQEVMEYLTAVMRGEQQDELLTMAGISKEVRVSSRDRNKAAELLGKAHGLFEKNVNLTGDMGIKIEVDYGDNS